MAIKAYIKNPKYGTGDEPEFLQVPFRGNKDSQMESMKTQITELYNSKAEKSELSNYVSNDDIISKGYIDLDALNNKLEDYISSSELDVKTESLLSKNEAKLLYQTRGDYITSDQLESKSDIVNVIKESGSGSITKSINPNEYYEFGEVESLDITLNSPSNPLILNIYAFQFQSGLSPTSLSVAGVSWINGGMPEIESGKTYQVTILNNIAAMGGA